MADKMHLGISELYHALFKSFLELLKAAYLPPTFKLNQADGEFHLEPQLLIRSDTINLSLQLICYAVIISIAAGSDFSLSIA